MPFFKVTGLLPNWIQSVFGLAALFWSIILLEKTVWFQLVEASAMSLSKAAVFKSFVTFWVSC